MTAVESPDSGGATAGASVVPLTPGAAAVTGGAVAALTPAGTPCTMAVFCCPYAKAEILNADKSVICAGAVHVVGEPVG